MPQVGKSTLTIIVDGIPIPVVPNSIKYTKGFGTKKVRSVSLGGGIVDTVTTENDEDKIGKVLFQIPTTDAQVQLITVWEFGLATHTVNGIDSRGIPFNLIGASMVNDPEINPTTEGVVDIEFHGSSMPL